jgi:hypothetical protein
MAMSPFSLPITEPLPHRRRPSRNDPRFGVFRFREKAREETSEKTKHRSGPLPGNGEERP